MKYNLAINRIKGSFITITSERSVIETKSFISFSFSFLRKENCQMEEE
uniref:Uncharacterized protein n=1 Tax=Wuchereria bancrofti TaxID=6293 RepID=A0AAF5RU71_WUCBA